METYKLKWTRLQNEIFRFLCVNAGKSINKREISRNLNVSPTAVAKALEKLKKEKIVKVEKHGTINLSAVELNVDRDFVIKLKRTENLRMIYESKITNFLENSFPGTTIVLFGSYSKGYDLFNSDIDIAIIGCKKKDINFVNYEKFFNKKISLNFYDSFNEIKKELKENIFNGIVLVGGIEL